MCRFHPAFIHADKGRQIFGLANINDVIIFVTSLRAVGHVVTVESITKCCPVLLLAADRSGKPQGVSFHRFAHFQDSDFERDMLAGLMNVQRPRKLKIGAVPTVFSHKPLQQRGR